MIGTKGHPVLHWHRTAEGAERFNATRENAKYLPGMKLSGNISATAALDEVAKAARLIIVSVPSVHFRDVARRLGDHVDGSQILVSTTKGIEAESFKLMTEVLREETCCLKIGALSGPNLAKEIAAKKPSGTVIASRYEEVIRKVQEVLSGPYFRVYSNTDVYGVELGGVLKNAYAIAIGLCDGLVAAGRAEAMYNTKSALYTEALREMTRLGREVGMRAATVSGLAGAGDLHVTGMAGRNRIFGELRGAGTPTGQVVATLKARDELTEGYAAIRWCWRFARERTVAGVPLRLALAVVERNGHDVERELTAACFGSASPSTPSRGGRA